MEEIVKFARDFERHTRLAAEAKRRLELILGSASDQGASAGASPSFHGGGRGAKQPRLRQFLEFAGREPNYSITAGAFASYAGIPGKAAMGTIRRAFNKGLVTRIGRATYALAGPTATATATGPMKAAAVLALAKRTGEVSKDDLRARFHCTGGHADVILWKMAREGSLIHVERGRYVPADSPRALAGVLTSAIKGAKKGRRAKNPRKIKKSAPPTPPASNGRRRAGPQARK